MFLKTLNRVRKTVGFRLAFWFCLIFVLSSLLVFSLGYFLLSTSIKRQDHDSIELKIEELSAIYQSGGIEQLKREISIDKKFVRRNPFFIRLADYDNNTILLILPYQWLESNLKSLENTELLADQKWIHLPINDNRYVLDVKSVLLKNSFILQVGKSNEERETILLHFRKIFSTVMILLIMSGFTGGIFVAHRALLPIRNLIDTLRDIESGKMNARVAVHQTDDELDELIVLFNRMLERIESLIAGMRDSLDNIAHDLRTPMTRFRGMAERALQADNSVESCEDALGACLEESDQILGMLNTLMDISEAETGTVKLNKQVVKASTMIERIIDLYRYIAEDRNIIIKYNVHDDLYINVDPKIEQAFSNLIDNAIKYSPDGGQIDLEVLKDNEEVIFRVRDMGIGIPEEELPKIWDRLFRGKQALSRRGLGLGLNLVKAIVEAHNGRIDVSSEVGKGSEFRIILPSI